MTSGKNETWYWDTWWAEGQKASCLQGPQGGYTGETERHWQSEFTALPRRAQLLDLCTGNGAIAVIAMRTSDQRGLDLSVTALDKAQIDPPRFVRGLKPLKKVRFLPATSAENTGLDTGSFHYVASQYGLEYADIPAALQEACRLIRPGGKLGLIMHAREGTPAGDAAIEAGNARFILGELDLFAGLKAAVSALAMPLSGQRMPDAVAKARNQMGRLQQRTQAQPGNVMLDNTFKVLSHAMSNVHTAGPAPVKAKLDEVGNSIAAHLERSLALIAAAQSGSDCQVMSEQLQTLGMRNIEFRPHRHSNPDRQVGWWLGATKPQ